MEVARALYIVLFFLLVLPKPLRNPAEVPMRSGLGQTLSSQQKQWSDHM